MMKKKTKFWIITAVALIIIGAIIGTMGYVNGASTSLGLNRHGFYIPSKELSSVENVQLDDFTSIVADVDHYQIRFIESDKNAYDMVFDTDNPPELVVKNNVLQIQNPSENSITIMDFGIGIPKQSDRESISIYYKKGTEFQNLDMELNYCDVDLGSLSCTTKSNFSFDYATVKADKLNSPSSDISAEHSELFFKDVNSDSLSISSEYGEVNIEVLTANMLDLESDFDSIWLRETKINDKTSIDAEHSELLLKGALLGNTTLNSRYSEISLDLNSPDYSYKIEQEYSDVAVNSKNLDDDTSHSENIDPSAKNSIYADLSYDTLTLTYK